VKGPIKNNAAPARRKALVFQLPPGASIVRDKEHPERVMIAWGAASDIELSLKLYADALPASTNPSFSLLTDPLKDFLEVCCEERRNLYSTVCDLMTAYLWWAEQNEDHYPLRREEFAEQLMMKGFRQNRSRRLDGMQCRTWEGLTLRPWALRIARQRKAAA
jgi:hypothetical protein